jgi:hypothetical protein
MKEVKLDITVEGGLEDFLGINIDHKKASTTSGLRDPIHIVSVG